MLQPISKELPILKYLVRKFYGNSHNFDLEPEQVQQINWNIQDEFLNSTLKNQLLESYPVNRDFLRLFLKKLLYYLEHSSSEVHDDFYTSLCLAMKTDDSGKFYYRHYIIGDDLNNIITIRETNNIVVNGTTGLRTWEAAKFLADWALRNVEVFKKKNILELGSGVGFTGITIAKFCQTESMILSDYHEDVLKTIKNNIIANFPTWDPHDDFDTSLCMDADQKIGVMTLDWNDSIDFKIDDCPDIIIGADIIYDPSILEPLHNVIQSVIEKNKNVQIFIAGVVRNEETLSLFLQKLDLSNIKYLKINQEGNVYIEWDDKVQIYLLKINGFN